MALLTLACNCSGLFDAPSNLIKIQLGADIPTITISYTNITYMIFFISFWCWDLSCAHFNPAITLGRFAKEAVKDFSDQEKIKSNGMIAAKIIFVQICGSLFGIFLTFIL